MSGLAQVDLKKVKLQVADVYIVAEGLKQQACCTSLDLSECCISDEGCKALADGLVHCNSLRRLVLYDNIIGDAGVKALAQCLKHLNEVKELDLKLNKIGDVGAMSLAESFDIRGNSTPVAKQYCAQFQKLDISYNHIGDVGAVALATSLKNFGSLTELDLKCNKIGDEGALAITRAVGNRSCVKLSIWNHRITKKGSRTISDLKQDDDEIFHVLSIDGTTLKEYLLTCKMMQKDPITFTKYNYTMVILIISRVLLRLYNSVAG